MSDAINRARDIIERYLPAMPDQQAAFVTRDAARALDAAGLLVSPEHDAAVAAKALREAAEAIADTDGTEWPYGPVIDWLHDRADRIEGER